MAGIFDELGVRYALGGSMASSLLGEPRSTVDVDMDVEMDVVSGEALLERMDPEFYVPVDSVRSALRQRTSFNPVDTVNALKVDVFVLGDDLLDRMQIERRVLVELPGAPMGIWVTAAEDQVLRKLDWYRKGGRPSDRQWRDDRHRPADADDLAEGPGLRRSSTRDAAAGWHHDRPQAGRVPDRDTTTLWASSGSFRTPISAVVNRARSIADGELERVVRHGDPNQDSLPRTPSELVLRQARSDH
jgi:hypothetical protein